MMTLIGLGLALACVFGGYVAAAVTGVFGAVVTPPDDRRSHLLVLSAVAYVCAMHTLSFGHSRYHLPVMPLVVVYSAAAVVRRREVWSRRGSRRFVAACLLVALLAAAWAWDLSTDLGRFASALRAAP